MASIRIDGTASSSISPSARTASTRTSAWGSESDRASACTAAGARIADIADAAVRRTTGSGSESASTTMRVDSGTAARAARSTASARSLARRLLPELKSFRLGALAEHFSVPHRTRHRAGEDARATARVFLRLLEHLRENGVEDLDGPNQFRADAWSRRADRRPDRGQLRLGKRGHPGPRRPRHAVVLVVQRRQQERHGGLDVRAAPPAFGEALDRGRPHVGVGIGEGLGERQACGVARHPGEHMHGEGAYGGGGVVAEELGGEPLRAGVARVGECLQDGETDGTGRVFQERDQEGENGPAAHLPRDANGAGTHRVIGRGDERRERLGLGVHLGERAEVRCALVVGPGSRSERFVQRVSSSRGRERSAPSA